MKSKAIAAECCSSFSLKAFVSSEAANVPSAW
jgi:hypothetical protein